MSHLEELLGRVLSPEARHSVPTLNDIGPEMLAEVKQLARKSPAAAVRYLQFHVARATEAPDFCDDVLLGDANPATWGTKDVVCFRNADPTALLKLTVADVMASLGAIDGERWVRLPATGQSPHSGAPGAPGVLVRGARYWWTAPSGTSSAIVSGPIERIGERDLPVAVRRWLASRFAWAARDYLSAPNPSIEGVVASLGGVPNDLSPDARAAIEGLIRESKLPTDDSPAARGFRGPEEWYAARS